MRTSDLNHLVKLYESNRVPADAPHGRNNNYADMLDEDNRQELIIALQDMLRSAGVKTLIGAEMSLIEPVLKLINKAVSNAVNNYIDMMDEQQPRED